MSAGAGPALPDTAGQCGRGDGGSGLAWAGLSLTPSLCSGVGFALCQRLLEEDGRIHLCIACRDVQKSEATRDLILATHPSAQVSTVEVDLGNLASILRAARELRCRYGISTPSDTSLPALHPAGHPCPPSNPDSSALLHAGFSAWTLSSSTLGSCPTRT